MFQRVLALARDLLSTLEVPGGVPSVTTYSERIVVIAGIIERYVNEHPRAADTPEGICKWWIARQRHDESLDDVQNALNYLVELGTMSRVALPDGAAVYLRAAPSENEGKA
jgi:hypothetical protein